MSETPNQDILSQVAPPANAALTTPENSPVEEPPVTNAGEVKREEKSSEKDLMLLNEEVEDRKADRALREKFGDKAYKVVRKTLYGWAILLFCYGFSKIFGFTIFPDNVMIAITSAVTLNIFAAFLGVIRGLFPAGKKDKD
ncbi:hypothetical protein GAY20_05570 [Pantoea dispersa]|uniref:hypothetical protein n=1 Tax=Pantoea dispersa TaxID=59814 RepID=UPI001266A538|nr:hypothetical protein [Pantoea dispersa]QFS59784.1 hypothetical protein GAY20_05570 [Pantoea dispersa]